MVESHGPGEAAVIRPDRPGEGGSAPAASAPTPNSPESHGRPRALMRRDDLVAFRRALEMATRRTIMTPIIIATCVVLYVVMIASGVSWWWPYASQIVAWGANDGARVILHREYWRLPASVFIHGGLIHLVVNMWSLAAIGPLVERIYGHLTFTVLYLAAGIGGAIASAAFSPARVSVGASGAICGILGGLLAFLVAHRRTIPPTVLRQLLKDVLKVLVYMGVLGLVVANIDQAAHLGGLGVGFLSGLLLIGPWPVEPRLRARRTALRALMTVLIAGLLSGSAVALAHRGGAAIPPFRLREDMVEQLAPIDRESTAIRVELARSIGLFDEREDPARQEAGHALLGRLRARAAANVARMRKVRVSDPELQAVAAAMADSVSALQRRLDALDRYLDTGDPAALAEAREALGQFQAAVRECETRHLRYLDRHGLAVPTRDRRPR